MTTKNQPSRPRTETAERKAPPLPSTREVLRLCRAERLGHKFADNLY